ncbi:N-acyl-D-aspartate/D-glutamate deacylase [Caulobacter ginsengisoli]|uniref:N-acyl-D-aspartate/D-glutamate deacylase n=1 Tax=Caulobacter ginsengisoli TaxID=400775 RepID=A0ABU0IQQ7_9CAUL|nr:amidohydrolase family protein [Caulobacter ginsengisoli]MDQ0464347.1 N-acyl-D-aspartate/D-glutamate deacylase [Caulobacter ginsengisoli]
MHDLVIRNGKVIDGTGGAAFMGDIAIEGGLIVAVGKVAGAGRREIDAAGLIVTPGWVDIHTHYDGQVTWDPYLSPSSWHGVTTAVMGNCGVGFAPVKRDRHDWLIELMEGVEDIPGSALAEGISWDWETFPEYLDSLDAQPRVLDVATQVPHSAVRAYVMGDRGARNEDATPEDIAAMSAIVAEGMAAGALGFSTSRTVVHTTKDGQVMPGTTAAAEELLAIGRAMAAYGPSVFEMSSDMNPAEAEFDWMKAMAMDTGVTVTYSLLQSPMNPKNWQKLLTMTAQARAQGASIAAQIACRPTGLVLGWQSTIHPFIARQSYRDIADLPFEARLAKLKDPAVRAAILADKSRPMGPLGMIMTQGFDRMFRLEQPDGHLDYEPRVEDSIAALAATSGAAPDAIVYDMLMEKDGRGYIYLPLLNYAEFNFDHIHAMMHDPNTVLSLSDGGAHCGVICDASFPTYMLTHWTRDRARGPTLPLEKVVSMQTRDTARLYGLNDRGVLAVGMKADLNVIDYEGLAIEAPEMVFDLPAQGRRMIQKARGYVATIVSGVVTYENGEATGAMPGRLVRGAQGVTAAIAAE